MKTNTKHTPTPWAKTNGGEIETVRNYMGDPLVIAHMDASQIGIAEAEANGAFIVRAVNCHEELTAVLADLLDQATGPAQVYGNGCGADGKKTGLTHWEFNKRRDEHIEAARQALAKAKGEA